MKINKSPPKSSIYDALSDNSLWDGPTSQFLPSRFHYCRLHNINDSD